MKHDKITLKIRKAYTRARREIRERTLKKEQEERGRTSQKIL